MAEVTLLTEEIGDWDSFHAVSAAAFGFPSFYGCNNNAWIDCLSYLTDADGMSSFVLSGEERLFISLPGFQSFTERQPEIAAGFFRLCYRREFRLH